MRATDDITSVSRLLFPSVMSSGFTRWMCISVLLWRLSKPLMHSDRLIARFFTCIYGIKEHISRDDSWNGNHRGGLRSRGEASQMSWSPCVFVCPAVGFLPRLRLLLWCHQRKSHSTFPRACVFLCAKACLDLNNNGGSDPDRGFTAVTLSHSETPRHLHPRPSDAASKSTVGRC